MPVEEDEVKFPHSHWSPTMAQVYDFIVDCRQIYVSIKFWNSFVCFNRRSDNVYLSQGTIVGVLVT